MHGGTLTLLLALLPATALAQEACPDAGVSPAEQALCWFDLSETRADPAAQRASLEQAFTHCVDAALDDPRVAEACFIAPLRLGRFADALEAFEYLAEPTPEQTRCASALSDVMPLRILSVPEGGAVEVDGEPVGSAPVDVRLASPWWERSIAARFGETRVEVEAARLVDAFDPRACAMSHLVIRGPAIATPTAAPADPEPPALAITPDPVLPPADGDDDAAYETWWFWTLVGVVVVGAAVGISVGVALDQPVFELGTFE